MTTQVPPEEIAMQKFIAYSIYGVNEYGAAVTEVSPVREPKEVFLTSDVNARIAEMEKYERAVKEHNEQCQQRCGIGDQEAVRCKYRPYFEKTGRRCPDCPVHEKIDIELMVP
jgi:hypothetical protein